MAFLRRFCLIEVYQKVRINSIIGIALTIALESTTIVNWSYAIRCSSVGVPDNSGMGAKNTDYRRCIPLGGADLFHWNLRV